MEEKESHLIIDGAQKQSGLHVPASRQRNGPGRKAERVHLAMELSRHCPSPPVGLHWSQVPAEGGRLSSPEVGTGIPVSEDPISEVLLLLQDIFCTESLSTGLFSQLKDVCPFVKGQREKLRQERRFG